MKNLRRSILDGSAVSTDPGRITGLIGSYCGPEVGFEEIANQIVFFGPSLHCKLQNEVATADWGRSKSRFTSVDRGLGEVGDLGAESLVTTASERLRLPRLP